MIRSPGRDIRDGSRTYSPRHRLLYFSDLPKDRSLRDYVRVRPELKISTGEVLRREDRRRLRSQSGEIIYDDRVMRLDVPCNEKRREEEGCSRILRDVFVKYIPSCVFFVFLLPSTFDYLSHRIFVLRSGILFPLSFSFADFARCTLSNICLRHFISPFRWSS